MVLPSTAAFGTVLLQGSNGGGGLLGGIIGGLFFLLYLAVLVVVIAGLWKTFEKAGQPGWGAIIPIYNTYLLLKIADRPVWWLLLLFIPVINFLVLILVSIDIAKNFGKGLGFGLGLAFLSFIFYPLLGFGDATYGGGSAGANF